MRSLYLTWEAAMGGWLAVGETDAETWQITCVRPTASSATSRRPILRLGCAPDPAGRRCSNSPGRGHLCRLSLATAPVRLACFRTRQKELRGENASGPS